MVISRMRRGGDGGVHLSPFHNKTPWSVFFCVYAVDLLRTVICREPIRPNREMNQYTDPSVILYIKRIVLREKKRKQAICIVLLRRRPPCPAAAGHGFRAFKTIQQHHIRHCGVYCTTAIRSQMVYLYNFLDFR